MESFLILKYALLMGVLVSNAPTIVNGAIGSGAGPSCNYDLMSPKITEGKNPSRFSVLNNFGEIVRKQMTTSKPYYLRRRNPINNFLQRNSLIRNFDKSFVLDPVSYVLFTRNSSNTGEELIVNQEQILNSSFDPSKQTKLILKDFEESNQIGNWVPQMVRAYLSQQDINIVVVDTSVYKAYDLFSTALPMTVSRQVAELIYAFNQTGATYDSFHIIGRAWSSHVAGVIGRILRGQVGRITALEPKDRIPSFRISLRGFTLDRNDAKFIDVVHINGERFFFHGSRFGLRKAQGHVDIYPNYGEKGLGCPLESSVVRQYSLRNCKKGRGVKYFIDSIYSPQSHPMCQCQSFESYRNGHCLCNELVSTHYLGESISNQTLGVFQLAPPSIRQYYF